MIRVLIADDQALVRDGLAAILSAEPDIDVAGVAADGREALARSRQLSPDVILMDIRMPNMDGVDATRRIVASGGARILVLTTFDLDEYVYTALTVGASGFLLKDTPGARIAHAVRAVAAGETLLDPVVTRRLVERFVRRPPPGAGIPERLSALSDREVEVMREVARGMTNREVAQRLVLSDATVKTHVASVLRKLGLRDRVQLVVCAYESGLVEPGAEHPQAQPQGLE